jgi:hypothetical protein
VLLKLLQRAGQQDAAHYTLGNLYHFLQNLGSDGTPLDKFVIKWAFSEWYWWGLAFQALKHILQRPYYVQNMLNGVERIGNPPIFNGVQP